MEQAEDRFGRRGKRDADPRLTASSDPPGVTFAELPPGSCRIAVIELDSELVSIPLDLVAGPNDFTVSVPELNTLTVIVPEGSPGDAILIPYGTNRLSRLRSLDDRLEATFEWLPAGEYIVSHEGLNPSVMLVHVSSTATVTYHADPFNSLQVVITSRDGALAGLGLLDEDLVVAINGRDFEDLMEMGQAYGLVQPGQASTYNVRRNGQLLNIEMKDDVLRAPRQWGGMLRPVFR